MTNKHLVHHPATRSRKQTAFRVLHHAGEAATVLSAGDCFAGFGTYRLAIWAFAASVLALCTVTALWVED